MEIATISENKIAKEFFKKYTIGAEVSRILYPESCSHYSKNQNVGSVTRTLKKLKEAGYIEERIDMIHKKSSKGVGFTQRTPHFRLNLKPFFEYANGKIRKFREKEEIKRKNELAKAKDKKHKKVLRDLVRLVKEKEFNKKEEKFLEYIFELPKIREMACNRETLFDGIMGVLEKIFFYHQIVGKTLCIDIAKAFFVEDKRQFKKVPDSYGQYKEFRGVIINFLDRLSNKIKDLTSFNQMDYYELKYNTKISTCSDIPFAIPKYCSEEKKKNLLKRWEISFYEKRKPTNDEMLKTR
jgi:hypothetical protein